MKGLLLGCQLHAAILRAVFGVGSCCFHTVWPKTLTLPCAIPKVTLLTVSGPVFVLLLLFVASRFLLQSSETELSRQDLTVFITQDHNVNTW